MNGRLGFGGEKKRQKKNRVLNDRYIRNWLKNKRKKLGVKTNGRLGFGGEKKNGVLNKR